MARRGNPIPPEYQAMNDYDRDMEIAEIRRTIEMLQRQMEQQRNNVPPRRYQREARGGEEYLNPFAVDDDSSDEDRDNRRPTRQRRV